MQTVPTTTPEKGNPAHAGHRRRLRERFLKSGVEGLNDYEMVELLLTLAIPRSDVKQPAKQLLKRFGNLRAILDAPMEELSKIDNIGSVTPAALQIIKAAAVLYLQQGAEKRDVLASQEQLESFWRMRIGGLTKEVFEVAFLDSSHCLLPDGVATLSKGTVDRAAVYPRNIIEAALAKKAAAVVLAHNHPNGVLEPSEQDKLITKAIVNAAGTVNLEVVDHLIVSPDGVFSFRRKMLL